MTFCEDGVGWVWGKVPHQVVISGVGVIFREGDVDPQSHTIGKDGEQDEDVEGP